MIKTIDWKKVYNWPASYADDKGVPCYEHCGGFCCSPPINEYVPSESYLLPTLPMIESEYDYLLSLGGLSGVTDQAHEETFNPAPGVSFKFYFVRCTCGGHCDPHARRPFICQIYPFFPLIDDTGKITGFENAALMDLFYPNDGHHPCYLVKAQREQVEKRIIDHMQPLITGNPEMIFLLKIAALVTKYMRLALPETLDLSDKESARNFFKRYVSLTFMRKPWRNQDFLQDVTATFQKVFNL